MRTIARIALLATFASVVSLAPAETDPAPPTTTHGFSEQLVDSVDLGAELGLEGRTLRMRLVTVQPGGAAALHSHKGRPGMVYVLQGHFIEHHDGIATQYGPGPGWKEHDGVTHWVENKGTEPAVQLSIDVVSQR